MALMDGLGLKPRVAFAPVRVAVTGRQVSPPLFESMSCSAGDARWPGWPGLWRLGERPAE